jgi:energy-coupling factor transport system substrate-specific component
MDREPHFICSKEMTMKEKLKAKDLIYAGAFAALYLILMLILITATAVVPITFILRPLLVGIVGAPVYMLYVSKVRKFGAVIILGVLFALVSASNSLIALAASIIFAVLAELICRWGAYESKRKMKLSYWVFNLNMIAPYLILVYAKPEYLALVETYSGVEYAQAMDALTPFWIIFVLAALAVVGAVVGTAISGKMMRKHFEKAGLV